MPMATIFGSVVSYCEGLPTIRSHDPFIKRYCEITRQNVNVISPLLQCLWPLNLAAR